jgi:hypothetical protein
VTADVADDLYAAILAEVRAEIAAGRAPDARRFGERIRAVGGGKRDENRALQQLERLVAVYRARSAVAREPAVRPPEPPRPALRRPLLRTRPTITGNLDVRRDGDSSLRWNALTGVAKWEIRIAERPDPRGDYVVRETRELPAETTCVELPLGDHPLRVHVLGHNRGGRLLGRAIVAGLTREGWRDKWERRASAP